MNPPTAWTLVDKFLEITNKWMSIIGEHYIDENGSTLEYWRVEKPDSIIIIPIWKDHFILSTPLFRPGLGRCTPDFPGGRAPSGKNPEKGGLEILCRELGLKPADIQQMKALNTRGWAVNSSFSNQHLFGFIAEIDPSCRDIHLKNITRYPCTPAGILQLLDVLDCLQCRALLLEWLVRNRLLGNKSEDIV